MTEPRRLTHPLHTRQLIARALLPELPPPQLGTISLLPHQRSAVARLRRILDEHHGALLADDVGLGKTFVALAVAHDYPTVHILAPAGLRDMWRHAIARAGPAHAQLHSLHACSRTAPPSLKSDDRTLVVIDEAHYLRNADTARYRAVALAVAGCDVLLLSATPLHNRAREIRTLFALFRGDRADSLTPANLAALIVRRTHASTSPSTAPDHNTGRADVERRRPTVRTHAPLRMPQDRETLSHILALPAPLPAHDGAVAGALIRLGLLRAWCSSDAALAQALRTRQLRGAALHDALRAGRHPTQQELRTWVVGEHEGQLAFPELLAAQAVESGPMLDILQRHLDALATLAQHHARHSHADTVRAETLRTLLERHADTPIVAFAQFARTIVALQRALADIAGVGVVTGRSGRIASGPLPRADVLASFAPVAHGRPPPPPHQRIRLLLATDLVAEGVNLQDAGVVVHLDLPWTDALRTQRVGRCTRLGSPHTTVHVYRVAPARAIERVLQSERRIARKLAVTRAVVGTDQHRLPLHSAPDRASAWHDALVAWHDGALHHRGEVTPMGAPTRRRPDERRESRPRDRACLGPPDATSPGHVVSVVHHHAPAALLLLSRGSASRLVALQHRHGQWHVHRDHRAVLSLMAAIDASLQTGVTISQTRARIHWDVNRAGIRSALRRWWRRQRVDEVAGRADHALTEEQQTCLRTVHRLVHDLPAADRRLLQDTVATIRHGIALAVGAGYATRLRGWRTLAPRHPDVAAIGEWLSAWRRDPLLSLLAAGTAPPVATQAGAGRVREVVQAVLLLVPD